MLIPFGVFSAAGSSTAKSYELISTTVLSSASANVSFTSIPQIYKHLQVRIVSRGNNSSSFFALYVTANGSSINAAWHRLKGDGSSVTGEGFGNQGIMVGGVQPNSSDTANFFAGNVIDILDYTSASKKKTIRYLSGGMGSSGFIHLGSGLWENTAAMTDLYIGQQGNQFVSGSRFSLYGIRG